MRDLIKIFCFGLLFSAVSGAAAQTPLIVNGKPVARIIANDTKADSTGAVLLRSFVEKITGAELEILTNKSSKKGDVLIGFGDTTGLTEDGFRLATRDGKLFISSGGDKGSIYGIVTLLEDYLGVTYYAPDVYVFKKTDTLIIPELERKENPAFEYRQSQLYGLNTDPFCRYFLRLEEPHHAFVRGYWVHTFSKLVPVSKFGKTNPEYYSYINGARHPGNASQLCLTNPEVLEVVVQHVDSVFKKNPHAKMISVSQNDGNDTYCTCPTCKELDEAEGSHSGTLIHFINKLAARFPDKRFSTLAYQYTMHPPKNVKPLPNVNIMLCNIDCRREVPLTDNNSGREFVRAMEGWGKICDDIFVWDYGINFDNYLVPFPNFHVLQKNIQLFKENNVTMHFSQIAGSWGGDFSELRSYMVSKLMWNTELNTDSLMRSFMNGYYGQAAPYIYQYSKLLEGGLLASGKDLWIYDTPLSHKDGIFNADCRKRYDELFDLAEAAVANDEVLTDRIHLTRLPLQYTDLEICRTEKGHTSDELAKKVRLFKERTSKLKVKQLNERVNTPEEYCIQYMERYLPNDKVNLAKNATITWITQPAEPYRDLAAQALTDGYFAGDSSKEEGWIGWHGEDGVFILDLNEEKAFSSVSLDFIQQLGQWSLFPKKVSCSFSNDGIHYNSMGEISITENRHPKTQFFTAEFTTESPVKARYVKAEIVNTGICPGWHFGAGHPAWFFIDEIMVK